MIDSLIHQRSVVITYNEYRNVKTYTVHAWGVNTPGTLIWFVHFESQTYVKLSHRQMAWVLALEAKKKKY